MNYYQFHIGDFRSGTINMSRQMRWIYRDMLDVYYDTETPLPLDFEVLCDSIGVESDDERKLVERILRFKFTKTDTGYFNDVCVRVIADYHTKAETAKANGKLGGRPSKAKANQNKPSGFPSGSDPVSEPNPDLTQGEADGTQSEANQEPITINQLEAKASLSPASLPPCPTQEIVEMYHTILPELPSIRLMNDSRRKALAVFWKWILTSKRSDGEPRAQTHGKAMDWILAYFNRARDNDFLMGRTVQTGSHANWQCDLDFLISEKGKRQVIEKTREAA